MHEETPSHYLVLINEEEQYSLWPADLAVPAGWRTVLPASTKEEALAYVEANWLDMRPASLRSQEPEGGKAQG